MRLVRVAMISIFAGIAPGIAWAENLDSTIVDQVVSANPRADGQSYVLTFLLKGVRRFLLHIPAAEAVKITDGLSKAVRTGLNKQQIAIIVQEVSIQAEKQGRSVLI
jgi:hypothetical protein